MNKNQKMTKTQILNVIILDRSASMKKLCRPVIEGFNDLIDGIRHIEKEYETTQEHYMTLVHKIPIRDAPQLSARIYRPYGMTPLYDAVGLTLCHTMIHVGKDAKTIVLVSVITDGTDNSSEEYHIHRLKRFICDLHAKGWLFTLMATDNKLNTFASEIDFDKEMFFTCDSNGIKEAFNYLHQSLHAFCSRMDELDKQIAQNEIY